jgi:hypothetical protein
LLRVFRNAGRTPVQIMDARAQATDEILRVIQRTHFLSIAADQGIRMTVLLFPFDDLATMENLEMIIRELGDAVDYVIVRNPAKNQTRMYDGSGLQSILQEWGAVEISLPVLFRSTLLQLDELEARHGRGITWSELNGIVSHVARTGAEFGKALEQATQTQMKASVESTAEIKVRIHQEFEKQNLPALTACLKKIGEHSERAVLIGKDASAQLQTIEQRCHQTISQLNQLRWASAWTVCASICAGLFVILSVLLYYGFRSHGERKLAEQIAQASFTIENNREVFAELALANVTLEVNRSSDATTGKPIPCGYAIIIRDKSGAEMRDYKGTKAGFIFVNSPKPEDVLRHLNGRIQELIRELRNSAR